MSESGRITCLAATVAMATGALTLSATAEPLLLAEADLRQLVPGLTIELDTPVGARLPISFTADGLMSGEAGPLEPYLGTARDRGRWWIADGRLCQKWFRWLDAKPRCATISRSANRILWREDGGEKGTATIVGEAVPAQAPPASTAAPARAMAMAAATPATSAPSAAASVAAASPPVARSAPAPAAPEVPFDSPAATGTGSTRFAAPGLAMAMRGEPAAEGRAANPPRLTTAGTPSPVEQAGSKPARTPSATSRRIAAARPFTPPIPLPTRPVVEKPEPLPSPFARAMLAAGGSYRVRGVMSNDVLNVRQGPSEEHPVIGSLQPGSGAIRIVGRCVETWCEVATPRAAGWVNVMFLAPERTTRRGRFDPFRSSLGGPYSSGS
ncbi:MAG: SH3 domain-containing protein [Hyphomicrobiaceae bacterium]